MSVTGISGTGRAQLFCQVDKVAYSNVLKGSDSLCRLLRYLAEQLAVHPGAAVKEYQLAIDVFGRPADFDPRLDATVRVQTGRLRSKLSEYYAAEGIEDSLILEIPKGSYALTIHSRPPMEPQLGTPSINPVEPFGSPSTAVATRPSSAPLWVLAVLCMGLLLTVGYLVVKRPPASVPQAPAVTASRAVQTFWRGFTDAPESPLLVFSNAEFIGRPETGMRYFDAARDSRDSILDHYTGVGEVLATHELDRIFTLLNHDIRVKRGRLLSFDDAKNNNLVFVGSPSENLPLRDIPTAQDFAFRRAESGDRKGDLKIVNLKPGPGEATEYLGSKHIPISEDYALIGLVPGMNSGRWAIILAGITTIGTQAAVEYVCREQNLQELIAKIGTSRAGALLPFEGVIQVKVTRGVPVVSHIVALHQRAAGGG